MSLHHVVMLALYFNLYFLSSILFDLLTSLEQQTFFIRLFLLPLSLALDSYYTYWVCIVGFHFFVLFSFVPFPVFLSFCFIMHLLTQTFISSITPQSAIIIYNSFRVNFSLSNLFSFRCGTSTVAFALCFQSCDWLVISEKPYCLSTAQFLHQPLTLDLSKTLQKFRYTVPFFHNQFSNVFFILSMLQIFSFSCICIFCYLSKELLKIFFDTSIVVSFYAISFIIML